ncbi:MULTISPECIES: D-aminoacyl-tRNA deacylase [unclassified Psychrobacter]|uniref:D-aminoacyl-tRNA deacylase n=1 Tax=unclassified Psychrobacter TaxID=196806 RepID=UPI0025B2EDC2|nr:MULTISPECIES: D-aminoacyl-tRNA deacylase [unclassified Psychrobacter]MDN3451993.1 D-aminoacyl-tRNA deacylase [Psychrobacter sp. APC 3350]MDN3501729.1 D-aminoacyl-tRNA deacylase [Psychrobacter sp. 5A.1]
MKALIQRVNRASVIVDQHCIGKIDHGVLAYIGLGHEDNLLTAQRMIDKILTYRIFENDDDPAKLGKLDKNVQQVGGGLLLVSQFTLMAKTDKGRRPDFGGAMAPAAAQVLFEQLVAYAKTQYPSVATGQFGADMQVESVNDGPLNFLLDI